MQKNILQIGKFSKFSFGGIELVTKIIADAADLSSIETICFGKHDKVFSKKYREFLTNFTISSQPISFSLIKFLIYKINEFIRSFKKYFLESYINKSTFTIHEK